MASPLISQRLPFLKLRQFRKRNFLCYKKAPAYPSGKLPEGYAGAFDLQDRLGRVRRRIVIVTNGYKKDIQRL